MTTRKALSYIQYAKYSKEKNIDIMMFAQFEEGDLLSETLNDTESGNESNDNSTLPPLIIEE